MSTAAQRKAWNEAMKNAGAILPSTSTGPADRRKARREKARKSTAYASTGAASTSEEKEYRVALHMDVLEGVSDVVDADDDEEYDELEELEEEDGKSSASRRKRRKRTSGGSAGGNAVPKYLRARSLASILIEEANRVDSVAKEYVNASVCRVSSDSNRSEGKAKSAPRKFCPVTGLYGTYVDPKSGIPYASLKALEQIRERAPPWMNAGGSGSYWEAVKTLRNDL